MTEPQPYSSVQMVTISDDRAGQRIDNYLLAHFRNVPKSVVYRILRKGEVRVNKGRVKPEYRLQSGDNVRIPPIYREPEKAPVRVNDQFLAELEASILFEDDQMLVINKPSGIAVHGGSGIRVGLIEAIRQMRPQEKSLELVHRLDRETSGCVMIAKKRSMLRFLHQALREGKVDKRYLALAVGRWNRNCIEVNAPLRKNELSSGERVVRVSADGKPSVTRFEVLEYFPLATLVEASPITGRTHQIRVHAQCVGHPLVGDEKYTNNDDLQALRALGFKRLFLHAVKLTFPHPDQAGGCVVEAPLDESLTGLLERWRKDDL